jgi:23S rRNA (cytidine1920-2'-O)/16S rRNA (cytidine1409-2'-O)-methyltransferase
MAASEGKKSRARRRKPLLFRDESGSEVPPYGLREAPFASKRATSRETNGGFDLRTTATGRQAGARVAASRMRLRWRHNRASLRKRLDVLLVERGLAESRAQAQALVLAGRVQGFEKPGTAVDETAELAVTAPPRFVSRGGEKLAHALDAFGIEPAGRDCLDVGASTGGFTDVLLQRGAARVVALDVGRAQLHERLRADPRVIVLERTNARSLTELPFEPDLITCDVSFISVRLVLPPVLALAAPGWEAVVLVKPQFEAGREDVRKGGVVRDPEVHRRVLREVAETALAWQAQVVGVVDSGLPGPKGNREFFLHLVHRERPERPDELDDWIDRALG